MDTFALTEGIVPEQSTQTGPDSETADLGKLSEGAQKFQRAIAVWRGECLVSYNTVSRHIAEILMTDMSDLLRNRFRKYYREAGRYGFGHCLRTA